MGSKYDRKPNFEAMYWRTTRANLRLMGKLKALQQLAGRADVDLKSELDKLLLDEMLTDDYSINGVRDCR